VNDFPTGEDDIHGVDEDDAATDITAILLANDIDPDTSDILSVITVDTAGTTGTVILNAGIVSYDPNGQFEYLAVGEWILDSFNYTISDGNGGTANATVDIIVNGVNDNPIAYNDTWITDEDSVLNELIPGILGNDTDPDTSDGLTVIAFDDTTILGAIVLVNADGSFSYDPTGSAILQALAVGEWILDSFNYTISDGNGGTANATVDITVNGVNDNPTANDDTWITDEDSVLDVPVPGVMDNDTDPDTSDGLTVIAFDNTTALGVKVLVNANGSFSYDPTGSTILQALAVGEWILDSFNYTISDANGGTSEATVTIIVNGVNDLPFITTIDITVAIGSQPYFVDYNSTAIDTSDVLTWSLSSNATWLGIDPTTGILNEIPINADGQYWVNISVSDGNGGVDWTNFILEVHLDTDDDGLPNTLDDDDDNDGHLDVDDAYPLDSSKWKKAEGSSDSSWIWIVLIATVIFVIIVLMFMLRKNGDKTVESSVPTSEEITFKELEVWDAEPKNVPPPPPPFPPPPPPSQ
jgi:VCBS repeat-containing protein